MNYVNLIGKMSSAPKFVELENGSTIANFTLSTKEPFLDEEGNPKMKSNWHRLSAWGNHVQLIREFTDRGTNLAVEGKLITRFYQDATGRKQSVSEVVVNDLTII